MLAIGTVLQERYQIARFLDKGGMGVVYEAIDMRLGRRPVAVKEMDAGQVAPAERQQTVAAFQQEARLLARLNHPGIAGVIDYFTRGDFSYLVMEYVEGETLDAALLRAPHGFQEAQALTWAGQLAMMLDYLHRQNPSIVFRDLKPGNIMVQPDGSLKLIDFGIARLFKPGQTQDTIRLGTPGYAAPEQYGHGQTDARSDVYSLGVVVHQLLTGHNPAVTPLRLPPVRQFRPDLSPQTEKAIAQALQLDPALRYTSTLALARALGAPVSGPMTPGQAAVVGRPEVASLSTRLPGGGERPPSRPEANAASLPGWAKALIAGLVLLVLLLLGWVFLRPLLDGRGADVAEGAATEPIVTVVVTPGGEGAAGGAGDAPPGPAQPTAAPDKTPTSDSADQQATSAIGQVVEITPTWTPLPTLTVPASPTPCQFQVLSTLRGAWANDLGCPINAGRDGISTGYAPFESGQMLWRGDNDAIYVLYKNGTWVRFADTWYEGDPDFSCGEQNSPPTPVRGFGRVWCDHQTVRDGLGAVTAQEIGDDAGSSQDFVNGSILIAPDGRAFVFLGQTNGSWR